MKYFTDCDLKMNFSVETKKFFAVCSEMVRQLDIKSPYTEHQVNEMAADLNCALPLFDVNDGVFSMESFGKYKTKDPAEQYHPQYFLTFTIDKSTRTIGEGALDGVYFENVRVLVTDVDADGYSGGVVHSLPPDMLAFYWNIPIALQGDTFVVQDSCKVLISGTDSYQKVLFANADNLRHVVFPKEMFAVYGSLFFGCYYLESVKLPQNIAMIPRGMFAACMRLPSVHLPDSVHAIGSSAFYNCTALETINLDKLHLVEDSAFCRCESLTRATFHENVVLGPTAFNLCKRLQSVQFNGDYAFLGGEVFNGCLQLKSVKLPKFVVSSTMSVTLDDWVIEQFLQRYLEGSDTLDGAVVTYKNGDLQRKSQCMLRLPSGCFRETAIQEIELPESLTAIGYMAFMDCKRLQSIVLPKMLSTIENKAFYGCVNLQSVEMPIDTFAIEKEAFAGCKALKMVDLSHARDIKEKVFYGCSALQSVAFSTEVYEIANSAFSGCKSLKCLDFSKVSNLHKFGEYAFYGCASLEQVIFSPTNGALPDGVEILDYSPFRFCDYAFQSIQKQCFADCSKLREIVLPETIQEIGVGAFRNCKELQVLRLPASVRKIGTSAFAGCKNLTLEVYPGTYAEEYCKKYYPKKFRVIK